MTGKFLAVILVNMVIGLEALLPFFKPCTRGPDPEFNICVRNSVQEAYAHLVVGNPEYGLPPLDPLYQDKIVLRKGSDLLGITVDITNATITGMKGLTFIRTGLDLDHGYTDFDFEIPELKMKSDYFLSGKLGNLLINGTGDENMTLSDINGTLFHDFETERALSRDGVEHEYINVMHMKVSMDIRSVRMQFNNLFNGDKHLEKRVNDFLSHNWRELFKFLGPAINREIAQAFTDIAVGAREHTALDELYPYGDDV